MTKDGPGTEGQARLSSSSVAERFVSWYEDTCFRAHGWPFSDERFFAPWRPIPVAPIGLAFLSARGLRIAVIELVLMSPLLIYALWPRRARAF